MAKSEQELPRTNNVGGASQPRQYKTYSRTNGNGKSYSNAAPSPLNKRGVEPSVTLKDSMGLAKMNDASAIQ